MFLIRERKIIELLYNNKNGMTTNELANFLHVSSRTIKDDVKKIKLELIDSGCILEAKTGRGMRLLFNEKGKRFLDNLLLGGNIKPPISAEIRKYYVALKLLDADGFTSMEKIADGIYVSKGTIVNDIEKLIPIFKKQSLKLEKKAKYGIRIIGTESQLRLMRASVMRKIVSYQGTQVLSNLQPFFANIDLEKINQILQEVEEKFNLILSDNSYIDLIIHLSIIVRRIQKGAICPVSPNELVNDKCRSEWEICEFIAKRLNEIFKVQLLDGDKSYILLNISGARLLNSTNKINKMESEYLAINYERWEEILEQTGKVYGIALKDDEILKRALFVHIMALLNRLKNQLHLENPLKNVIKEELVYEFEIATNIAKSIYHENDIELGEDEICDIALYIGASIERRKTELLTAIPHVIIVCGSGMGTSQFFQAKLKSVFPNLNIDKVIPISRLSSELEHDKECFIISTVPLILDKFEVINVSPMLSSKDIIVIENKIFPSKVKLLTDNGQYQSLYHQFYEDITFLKSDYESKNEVIEFMAQQLQLKGYVKESYSTSVFEREKLAPTNIGNSFAIPHAFEGHIIKQGIGLMTLKRPIIWGTEKVQIILMIAIDERNKHTFQSIFEELACITKDMSIVERILSAEQFNQIKRTLYR